MSGPDAGAPRFEKMPKSSMAEITIIEFADMDRHARSCG